MGKASPVAQRVMVQGGGPERLYLKEELRKKVEGFQNLWRGKEIHEREQALMKVIERISKEEEDIEFIIALMKSGGWLLELEGCLKRHRWLKTWIKGYPH